MIDLKFFFLSLSLFVFLLGCAGERIRCERKIYVDARDRHVIGEVISGNSCDQPAEIVSVK